MNGEVSRFEELLMGARVDNTLDGVSPDDQFWAGRYGSKKEMDASLFGPLPGFLDSYDLMAQLKQQGLPQAADSNATLQERLGNYATPPDLFGRYPVGLNDLGQPVYEVTTHPVGPGHGLAL